MNKYKNKLLKALCDINENIQKYIVENEDDYFEINIPNRNNHLFLQIVFEGDIGLFSIGYSGRDHIHYDIDDYKKTKDIIYEVNKYYIQDLDLEYEEKYLSNQYCFNIFKNTYYNETKKILEINFDTSIYEYFDVPVNIVKEFNDCENKWSFFNSKIKNKYAYKKIVSYESIF